MTSPRDNDWILDHLAELIRFRGPDTFLRAPIVEPTRSYFPQRWAADMTSLRQMLRSLLGYVGLEGVRLRVEIEDIDGKATISAGQEWTVQRTYRHSDAAAWFMSVGGDECVFGVAEEKLHDPDELVGILAHEVAHAYRARHGLEYRTRREDEPLTDLTTVYLGLGLLRTRAVMPSRVDDSLPEWEQIEYMQPRFLSFAMAAQAVARGLDDTQAKQLAAFFPRNPQSDFLSARTALREQREGLLEQLGIASRAARISQNDFNVGLPVFRVKSRWPFASPRCSDPDCNAKVPRDAELCPGCGGTIEGDVASAEEARSRESNLVAPTEDSDLSRLLKGG